MSHVHTHKPVGNFAWIPSSATSNSCVSFRPERLHWFSLLEGLLMTYCVEKTVFQRKRSTAGVNHRFKVQVYGPGQTPKNTR